MIGIPIIKEFGTEFGMSAEIKGVWHRFSANIKVELTPEEQTPEQITDIKQKCWNTVISEVERKVEEAVKSMNGQG